jgi:FkbM family methyltransferase
MIKFIKNGFYLIIDLITLKKGINRTINGFEYRFPVKWSRYYEQGYESSTFQFFKENIKKGDTILDIGAHIGLYSIPFSKLTGDSGKVFCFEPTQSTFSVLNEIVKLNKLYNIQTINEAIDEIFNLTSDTGEGSNANSIVNISRTENSIELSATSIDDFRRKNNLKIDAIKIDVEGAELNALKGARNTFFEDRPYGILALHPKNILDFNHSLEDIWSLLIDYKLEITHNGNIISKDEFCNHTLLFDIEFRSK